MVFTYCILSENFYSSLLEMYEKLNIPFNCHCPRIMFVIFPATLSEHSKKRDEWSGKIKSNCIFDKLEKAKRKKKKKTEFIFNHILWVFQNFCSKSFSTTTSSLSLFFLIYEFFEFLKTTNFRSNIAVGFYELEMFEILDDNIFLFLYRRIWWRFVYLYFGLECIRRLNLVHEIYIISTKNVVSLIALLEAKNKPRNLLENVIG